jgi:hypothetical protein
MTSHICLGHEIIRKGKIRIYSNGVREIKKKNFNPGKTTFIYKKNLATSLSLSGFLIATPCKQFSLTGRAGRKRGVGD